jgi:TonB-dependent SusC/RagA subfamily outer membrane receptor
MKIRITVCLILTLVSFSTLCGQKSGKKMTISGYVRDGTEASIANAIVLIDGEKTGLLTDRNGYYKIRIRPENKKIGIFTYTNGIIEEKIDGRSRIDFRFSGSVPDQRVGRNEPGDEPVDIGYGVARKKTLTAPVGKIDGTKSKYASYNNIYDMIRGEVSGVVVNGSSIMIRSATTINSGTEPLFVVDGVPVTTIADIQPQMVESIEVLKGSAAAIYGARGSNGVIIINLLHSKSR